ncbi:MAG: TorF family putative porin [Comamonas sp.]|uniref:TorF family putative porin n=1 Tax=Comamonas sp. TaxID=34028 RepID=UPI002649E458|nr:TorF family putative porin [Comamonas sp.]MDN5502861.1 TorF family putative porin [Comamonas sp.]MDN5538752.1 TorF family putative porin [Comamonas sp.]
MPSPAASRFKTFAKTATLACAVVAPMWAHAQLSANVALTTNYKFRGQDQDASRNRAVKPALQGGFDYTFGDSGFYVGNWNSSVDWLPGNSLETDFYGGYKFKAADVDWDVGLLTYVYSGNANGNTTEIYGSGTYGPFTAKYSHTVSKDYFGWAGAKAGSGLKGRNTGYLQFSYSQEVMPKVTLKASVGYTHFSSDIKDLGVPNYVDYSVGGAYDLGDGFSAGAAVTGANKKAYFGDVNKARLILTLSKTF